MYPAPPAHIPDPLGIWMTHARAAIIGGMAPRTIGATIIGGKTSQAGDVIIGATNAQQTTGAPGAIAKTMQKRMLKTSTKTSSKTTTKIKMMIVV